MSLPSPSEPSGRDAAEFSRLAHLIYEAAAQPQAWPQVVAAVAQSMRASKGLMFTPGVGPQDGGMAFPWQISERHMQLWATQYIGDDIWAANARRLGLWRQGLVMADERLVPREEFLASRFYREFLSASGIGRMCCGVVFEEAPGLPGTALSVFRDVHEPPFSEADQDWLRLLVPHLSRSLGLMYRLGAVQQQTASLMAALDRLAFGVVLLDGRTQVLHLNSAARAVVGRGDGLEINAQRQLAGPAAGGARAGLSHWLESIRDQGLSDPAHFSDSFMVARAQGDRRYAIQCSGLPVTDHWQAQGEAVRFVAFITDPDAVQMPDTQRLCRIYGFTETQARVASGLAGGRSYKEVAGQLNISEETVRSHVKEIYPKARVNRQSDLTRAIMSIGLAAV
ncbi:helix-turn-helix transcriptional regulator [Variovorax terrae]|uniref:Helix-turn-helix transcriptional regulator n=1 Tax=Variovorax terrae TaxID=2923278 RepID=A0A9X2ANY6_9BURK|nr:helix-turn-helix transcriptional regulator [Variovorax terrae]MCJ0764869.1 helix-turn-helix transcriptional regulator [Variovorax terrae]